MPQPTATLEKPTTSKMFNSSDRCDACGAQAYAAATFIAGDLLFCGHHFKKHQTALEQQSLAFIDQTANITTK